MLLLPPLLPQGCRAGPHNHKRRARVWTPEGPGWCKTITAYTYRRIDQRHETPEQSTRSGVGRPRPGPRPGSREASRTWGHGQRLCLPVCTSGNLGSWRRSRNGDKCSRVVWLVLWVRVRLSDGRPGYFGLVSDLRDKVSMINNEWPDYE